MDSSIIQNNIFNAFQVVRQSNNNLAKLFKDLDEEAGKLGYVSLIQGTPGFLRYRSETDVWGWVVSNFIKAYRKKGGGNHGDAGPASYLEIYGIEVSFEDEHGSNLRILKYEYDKNDGTQEYLPVNSHWQFYWPTRSNNDFLIEPSTANDGVSTSVPKNDVVSTKYRWLKEVRWKSRDLVGIKHADLKGLVMEFDEVW